MTVTALTRRSALRGGLVVVGAGAVGYALARTSGAARTRGETTAANEYGAAPSYGRVLARLRRVPLGGGLILTADKVVLTREPAGRLHAFSAVCTHQGCLVAQVSAGVIMCPCHGSRFNAWTGAVIAGPAGRPLPPVAVTVRDGDVRAV